MDTRIRSPRENQEGSGDVVIDAVVAPEDGSGPCCSVKHQNWVCLLPSQKGHCLPMKRVGHPLSSTGVSREVGPAWTS